jgi:hypothetical protein
MTNPQPDAVTGAETRLVADAEAVVELMERGILPSRNDVRDIAALLRSLLALLATLREERDALLADKARLDWLERDHNAKVYPSQCFGDFGVRVMHEDGIGFAESGKVRDAIDAARAAHQGTEP